MPRAATMAAFACLLAACPTRHSDVPDHEPAIDDSALRIMTAKAEAERDDGVRLLQTQLGSRDPHAKLLALRGLGRIGGSTARTILIAALADKDPDVIAGAMAALGIARELDDLSLAEADPYVGALHNAYARTRGEGRVLAIEALGRAGDQRSQPLLVNELAATPDRAEAAGIALGRQGRRKIALAPATVRALIAATNHADPRVRYAAVYAFSRAQPMPSPDPAMSPALAARVGDQSPEIRAQAIAAIAKHGFVGSTIFQLERGLVDADWRVAVEAVRALTGDKAQPENVDAVAVAIVRLLPDLDRDPAVAHIVIEGLRGLQKYGSREVVSKALEAIGQWAPLAAKTPLLTKSWIECLATAANARTANTLAPVFECAGKQLPDHLRLPLVADLITAGVGTEAERRDAMTKLLANNDDRVRAAAIGALSAGWKTQSRADQAASVRVLVAAIGVPSPIIAGSAVDAAGGFYDAIGKGDHAAIDDALVARARDEQDAELSASLLDAIAAHKISAGVEACRNGLGGAPARAKAARACLTALGEPSTGMLGATHAPPPPVDIGTVIGKRVLWSLTTTRGEIMIELRPDVAPWAVASIVALTERGKYDGLELHRVVPDFVAQGGDPTESGWGGPGYVLPAEPGSAADGAGYVAGGVGMADAGRDSAGSQWFIMHARAPHLDGRYTWVGRVVSGQKSADALLIGDAVVKAVIERH